MANTRAYNIKTRVKLRKSICYSFLNTVNVTQRHALLNTKVIPIF